MKYVFYSGIVLMAVLPAQAQQAPATTDPCILQQKSDSSAPGPSVEMVSDEAKPAELLVGYALNVDGLLLGLGEELRTVSEKVEAGELTQLEAVVLKARVNADDDRAAADGFSRLRFGDLCGREGRSCSGQRTGG